MTRSIEGCCNSHRASSWNGAIASTPSQATWLGRDRRDRLDDGFVRPDDREKIAVADDLDRALGGTPQRSFVDVLIVAPGRGWRTTRACTMPSRAIS